MKSIITRVHFVFLVSFALLFAVMGAHKKANQESSQNLVHSEKHVNSFEKNITLGIFLSVFVVLLSTYIWLIKSLKPLGVIRQKIITLRDEDSKDIPNAESDEVSDIIYELEKTNKKITAILDSRQMFLRAIIHEVNSPIAKARIVAELVTDEKQKNRLIKICEQMDMTIKEFIKIEQILSKNMVLYRQECQIGELISSAIEMCLDSTEDVTIKAENDNICISADKELMALCFKNLIQNGIKYSFNKSVNIEISKKKISFVNFGEDISDKIQSMYEPYINPSKSKNSGLGLGLYIINSVVKIHGMRLEYTHNDGVNRFDVVFDVHILLSSSLSKNSYRL